MKHLLPLLLVFTWALPGFTQGPASRLVFEIGQDETNYQKLSEAYPNTLLNWKQDDYTQSALLWFDFLKSMEIYAESISFNINGLKLWLHVFWDEKGGIQHLGYFIHPESRQIEKVELEAFLSSFSRQAKKPDFRSGLKLSHYTAVSFPTFARSSPR